MLTTFWILAGVFAFLGFFLLLSLVLKRVGGYAPGWRIRCAACGQHRPAAEAGIIRIAAVGTKHTIAKCSACGKVGHAIIERDPPVEPHAYDASSAIQPPANVRNS